MTRKRGCVGGYNCPKLRTLQLCTWFAPLSVWSALKTGTHAMDLTTNPVDLRPTWFKHIFVVAEPGQPLPRCHPPRHLHVCYRSSYDSLNDTTASLALTNRNLVYTIAI